jgi:hypothetical protein
MNHRIVDAAFLFSLAVTVMMVHGVSAKQSARKEGTTYSSSAEIEARRTKDFSPDGDLSKKIWKQATWVEFDHDMSRRTKLPNAATRVAVAWSDHAIYFAFECRYDVLNVYEGEDASKERLGLWDRDVAEVFLNPQPETITHYYEFEVAPNNQWVDLEIDKTKEPFGDANWNSGFAHATKIDARNHIWIAEFRIPSSSMKVRSIRPGALWRVNFFRVAGPGGDDQRMFLAWSTIPEGRTFHVPSRFGILRFVN